MQHHHYSLHELENMMPEKEIYVSMDWIKLENERLKSKRENKWQKITATKAIYGQNRHEKQ